MGAHAWITRTPHIWSASASSPGTRPSVTSTLSSAIVATVRKDSHPNPVHGGQEPVRAGSPSIQAQQLLGDSDGLVGVGRVAVGAHLLREFLRHRRAANDYLDSIAQASVLQ